MPCRYGPAQRPLLTFGDGGDLLSGRGAHAFACRVELSGDLGSGCGRCLLARGHGLITGRADRPEPPWVHQIRIRDGVGADDYPALVRIWRSAVDATHDFLTEADRADIQARLPGEYFPQVTLTVAELDGVPVGFAGTAAGRLEMLFVAAAHRGAGVGRALLAHVVAADGVAALDVNEQNPQAVRFYARNGFAVVGRSACDDAGRPYPLLHMARPRTGR